MRFPALLLFSCLFLLGGCASYGAEYREMSVTDHSAADIFQEIVRYARTRGYRANREESDESRRVFVSEWRGGGVPIAGRFGGRRHRLFAEVVRPSSGAKGWSVLYYFEVHRIGEIGRGLNAEEGDWEEAGQDSAREREFAHALGYTLMGRNRALDPDRNLPEIR